MNTFNSQFSCDVTDLLSAMLVHRKLISICQITHVCFDLNNNMPDLIPSDNLERKAQEKKNVEDPSLTELSDYAKNPKSHVLARY